MIDGSGKGKSQLAFELQNWRIFEKRSSRNADYLYETLRSF